MFSSWWSGRVKRKPKNANRVTGSLSHFKDGRKRRTRPVLEVLEDRLALAAFTVTSLLDDGSSGTLRWAINQANVDTDPVSNINFNIPGAGTQNISITSALPAISHPVIIDGTTQPGYGATPLIELSGAGAGPGVTGLTVTAGSSTVMGLDICGFSGNGIAITSNGGSTIQGNYIGTDPTGTVGVGNGGDGVLIQGGASNNTIGGTVSDARNIISGNGETGIQIDDSGTTGNVVAGNFIGTDATGTVALGNSGFGVLIDLRSAGAGATNNTIGGNVAGAGNIISGNIGNGVEISGAGTSENLVAGNYIGTDVTGTVALGNGFDGVALTNGASGNTLGGTTADARNIISGNPFAGIEVDFSGTTNNVIEGNFIGTDFHGNSAIPNRDGVVVAYGAANQTIGGTAAGAGNVISGNTVDGVDFATVAGGLGIASIPTSGNLVEGNYIGTNAAGTGALGNHDNGVKIYGGASANTIGGNFADARNIISGNDNIGVALVDPGTTQNVVAGNYIGTDKTGNAALGNLANGILINSGPTNNTIGGLTATPGTGAGNLISGNGQAGAGTAVASNNLFEGNIVGLNAAGTAILPNDGGVFFVLGGTGNTLGGTVAGARNIISGNTGFGIQGGGVEIAAGTSNTVVQGNYIGTDITGTVALGTPLDAIVILGANNNTIGGTTAADRNIISGNGQNGITMENAVNLFGFTGPATGNLVEGNFIGTNAAGTAALPNQANGVLIKGSANNTIGGTVTGAGNLISGNGQSVDFTIAVAINGAGASNNLIAGNYIGTDVTGTIALPNAGGVGISTGASNNTIGGTTAGARNIISGNEGDGVNLFQSGTGNLIKGNFIGTDVTGTIALGNTGTIGGPLGNGVNINSGSTGTTIGGTTAGAGNLISGNTQAGIGLFAGDNLVEGNFIGTDVTGTRALGIQPYGIKIGDALDSTIGGTTAGAGNLISGNTQGGVGLFASNTNLVEGNFVGTDVTGTHALGIQQWGVIIAEAGDSTIGGTTAGAGNLISGNAGIGLGLYTSAANLVEGNFIGTDVTGTRGLGIQAGGVQIGGALDTTIGGTAAGARNVISGNTAYGIELLSGDYSVEGNHIGTDYTGTQAVPNAIGVEIQMASDNAIGGTAAGAGNVIAYNSGVGVAIVGPGSTGDAIRANSIYNNGGLGIQLTSANNNQAFPTLTATTGSAGGTVISGTLSSTPNTTFALDFFANAAADPSGYGQGQVYLGSASVTTNGSGNGSFTVTFAVPVGLQYLSATATDPNGDTSQFSQDISTNVPPTASAGGPYTMTYGGSVTLDASASQSPEGYPLTYSWTVNGVAGSASGVNPTLTWSQLQALGVSAAQVYTVSVRVSDGTFATESGTVTLTVQAIPPSSLSGTVFTDFNDDGEIDFGEMGIAGVAVALTGTDNLSHAVSMSQTTDADGSYMFLNLLPGSYQITETQPAGYLQGIDTVGTAGGSLVATDQFFVQLAQGVNGLNYNFGEQPPTTGGVKKGQTAGIGFWNNKNGQALILALNGGTGHQLGDWLAATMPNTFGVNAGSNNLTGESNAFVAALFQQDFLMKGVKLDAQVLATALSVYVTDSTLDSTAVAAQYGFTVSSTGLGTDTVNVGSNGDVFGVVNNTNMTVLDLLVAADAQAVNGVLYNGNTTERNEANSLFSALNEAGDIS